MTRTFMAVVMVSLLLFSCKSNKNNSDVAEIDINKFDEVAPDYVDKEVSMTGLAVHVCMHSGKKLHLVGDDQEKKIVVYTSEDLSSFPTDIEGKTVKVFGFIREEVITVETIQQWEAEMAAAEEEAPAEGEVTEEKEGSKNTEIEVSGKDGQVVAADGKTVSATDKKSGSSDGEIKVEPEKVKKEDGECAEKEAEGEKEESHDCGNKKFAEMRKQIAESEDGKIRRYWMEVTKFEVVEEEKKTE